MIFVMFEIHTLIHTGMAFGAYTEDDFFEFIDEISIMHEIANYQGYGFE